MPANRLRVLFLIGILTDTGGAERFVSGLARHLPRDRFDPWVCAPRGASADAARLLSEAGIPLVDLGRRTKWDFYRFASLIALLRKERFDVLHTHLFGSNFWGTLIGRACGVPVVIAHEHTWAYSGSPGRAWLDGRVIGRLATRFVAVSDQDARRMVDYERVPPGHVLVMPTAYIPRRQQNGSTDIRTELGLGRHVPLIATAVLFRPQKAIEVLISAHALLVQHAPDAQLVIAGDGPCRQEWTDQARQLGLDGRVHFLGVRKDVEAILSAADIAALSSDFEGMPLFVFECMANRIPLVSTAVGGIPSVVEDGRTGLLVPPRDPDALAQALRSLVDDPERRRQLAAAAWERLPRFSIEHVAQEFAELYESLVAETARR